MYNILIIEDEYPTRELLKGFLAGRLEFTPPATAATGREWLEKIRQGKYDIVLLDINLPDMSGLDIMQELTLMKNTYVIFSTAYNQHALTALDAGAVDYLLKPYSQERFTRALDKALVFLKNSHQETGIAIRTIDNFPATQVLLPLNEIIYLSSNGKHTIFHTTRSDYETSGLLKDYFEMLPSTSFLRIHKQYIVNRHFISGMSYANGGAYSLLLKDNDDTMLPVGKMHAAELKTIFVSQN